MHRVGEHRVIVLEDGRGTVSLVNVEVDHQTPSYVTFGLQNTDGYRDVIEHAVPLTSVGEGMVSTPGEVAGDSVFERGSGRRQRPADRGETPSDELLAPGDADAPTRVLVQVIVKDLSDVLGRVDPLEVLALDQRGGQEVPWREQPLGQERVAEFRVFGERETVPFGQRERMVV